MSLAELLRTPAPSRSALDDVFAEEPVPLATFVEDRAFLANPPLSPVQYEAVRFIERVYYPETYAQLAEHSDPYWSEPVRMVNFVCLAWAKGCLLPSEELYDALTGQWVPVSEVASSGTTAAVSPNGVIRPQTHSQPFRRGRGDCYRVTTGTGLQLQVYAGHQFLTKGGWRQLRDLEVGDQVAQATEVPCLEPVRMDDRELELIGWWLGDGVMPSVRPGDKDGVCMLFGFAEEESLARYLAVCAELGVDCNIREREGKKVWYVNSQRCSGHKKKNPLTLVVERYGLRGKTAYNVRVPKAVFSVPDDQVALFLSRLWTTDGWVYAPPEGSTQPCEIGYSSINEGMVRDVQRLLLRLGISGEISAEKKSGFGSEGIYWRVRVRTQADVRRFCERVRLLDKWRAQDRVIAHLDARRARTNRVGYLGSNRLGALRWTKIKSIEYIGEHDYWDLTVDQDHNYVAGGGLLNHNSGKDHVCRMAALRVAYLLACLKNPQAYYGLPEQDTIHMLNVASSSSQANQAFFTPMTRAVGRGWFTDKCSAKPGLGIISWRNNVEMISGHADAESQEGLNIILGVADEVDAFKTRDELMRFNGGREPARSLEGILKVLRTSASTRFPETFKNVFISYPRFVGSPILNLLAEARADNAANGEASLHFASGPYATWEVNPRYDRFPKVEIPQTAQLVPDVATIKKDYEKDPATARMVYECRPERAISTYYRNMDAFRGGVEREGSPLTVSYELVPGPGPTPVWSPVFAFASDLVPQAGARYVLHADLAVKGDAAGVALAHVASYQEVEVEAEDEEGVRVTRTELRPVVRLDAVTSFEADLTLDPAREIQLRWVRQLVLELTRRAFPIACVSYDGYQSVDSRQILEAQGFTTERISADRGEDAWATLRDVAYEGRLRLPYDEVLFGELAALGRLRGKVDHPPMGSKDRADAVACAVVSAIAAGGEEEGARLWPGSERFVVGGLGPDAKAGESRAADPGDPFSGGALELPFGFEDFTGPGAWEPIR